MNGISIQAWRGDNYLSLPDVLEPLQTALPDIRWHVHIDEATPGERASVAVKLLTQGQLTTAELLRLFTAELQIIDGHMDGYTSEGELFIRVRAVDSTWWDVEVADADVLNSARKTFPQAIDLPIG